MHLSPVFAEGLDDALLDASPTILGDALAIICSGGDFLFSPLAQKIDARGAEEVGLAELLGRFKRAQNFDAVEPFDRR